MRGEGGGGVRAGAGAEVDRDEGFEREGVGGSEGGGGAEWVQVFWRERVAGCVAVCGWGWGCHCGLDLGLGLGLGGGGGCEGGDPEGGEDGLRGRLCVD